jgi:hypothetical protein
MDQVILMDVGIYVPVILKMILLVCLLYIPLPIVLWIYRRRKGQPKNNFTGDGSFQGFKINAGGSVALYFILFLACLSSSIPIIKSIDETQSANEKINRLSYAMDSLLTHTPWKLKYSIHLMTDSMHSVDNEIYTTYLNSQHFNPFPPALDMNPVTHIVTCYIDEDLFESNNNNYTLNIDNFNSGFELHINPALKQQASRTINLGVRVNVISPGTTDTPVFDKFVPAEQLEAVKKYWAGVMPIGRIGQPSDIGKTAVFLASDDSSFMLGAELLVDGGLTYLSPAK